MPPLLWWWKVELKKTFEIFFVQYMPHRNFSTAFVSQHIWKWLTVHSSMDPGQQLLHTKFSFWQISQHKVLIWKWPIFVISVRCVFNKYHSQRKSLPLDANYSIKHNTNILIYSILQIDVCLRFQNLKTKLKIGSQTKAL